MQSCIRCIQALKHSQQCALSTSSHTATLGRSSAASWGCARALCCCPLGVVTCGNVPRSLTKLALADERAKAQGAEAFVGGGLGRRKCEKHEGFAVAAKARLEKARQQCDCRRARCAAASRERGARAQFGRIHSEKTQRTGRASRAVARRARSRPSSKAARLGTTR